MSSHSPKYPVKKDKGKKITFDEQGRQSRSVRVSTGAPKHTVMIVKTSL